MALTPTWTVEGFAQPTTTLNLTTSQEAVTLSGTLAETVVDVQVRINGGPFRSDASLVSFDATSFQVPNPLAQPEGLPLNFGVNTLEVRTVDLTGAVSASATARLEVVRSQDLDLVVAPPSGLRVVRQKDAVSLLWVTNVQNNILGYHVYASEDSGGGTEGYVRVNAEMLTTATVTENLVTDVDANVLTYTVQGTQLRVRLIDEDIDDTELAVVGDVELDTSLASGTLQVTTTVERLETLEFVKFSHDRNATESEGILNQSRFAAIPADEPLFYVITAIAYDPVSNQQLESVYSSELIGLPLQINTQLLEIVPRTREDITRNYLRTLVTSDSPISGIPGSVVRDIFLDPPASEAERLHFIMDFVRRSQSFATLIAIDDLDGDGLTDAVADNSYKTALKASLGLENDADVQSLIDDSFDKLATNVEVTRGGADFAIGQAVFFTTSEPTLDRTVEVGTFVTTASGASFQTTSRVTLPFATRQSFYNIQTQRYEITVPIRAANQGEAGNVPAGQIQTVLGGGTGLQVTNLEATRFGRDREANLSLAERAILALASVDAGTEGGYLATALSQVGVFRALIVKAGDDFMMRDYDEVREKHIGGKVDVYVQGENLQQVKETFALTFDVARDIQFVLDSNPADLIFITRDPRITPESPLVEILGTTPQQILQGFGFRNATSGQDFLLTGVVVLSYNRIQLNTALAQPLPGANDLILGDVRYQSSSSYVPASQPVFSLTALRSLTNQLVLTQGTQYALTRSQDPLLQGYSTRASDTVQITPVNGIPSGAQVMVNDERQVLLGQAPVSLDQLGANPLTIRVFNLARTLEYQGPFSGSPDFEIVRGSATTPVSIVRVPTGSIATGQEVSVDYLHDENFELEYTTNALAGSVQLAVNAQRHITADVLVKQALPNPIDLEMTVVLDPGAVRSQVDALLRTNLSQLLNSRGIGEPLFQSDVVRVIENTKGVRYVVVPFARMALADGSLILREPLEAESTFLGRQGNVNVYVLNSALDHPTLDNGGSDLAHKGIFQDGQILTSVPTYAQLFGGTQRALVLGNSGRAITGYSDDPTLTAAGFTTAEERETERVRLTANRVFLSLLDGEAPDLYTYQASYVVQDEQGSQSISPSQTTYVELGDLSITYQQ
jgi:hypothetical protein